MVSQLERMWRYMKFIIVAHVILLCVYWAVFSTQYVYHHSDSSIFYSLTDNGVYLANRDSSSSSSSSSSRGQSCFPVLHIYYIKCHKTGSSTLTNILHRIALHNNLTITVFGTPDPESEAVSDWSRPDHVFPHPLDISAEGKVINEGAAIHKYDMSARHTIYNESNIVRYMQPDTQLFGTIREPFAHLKSSFNCWKIHLTLQIYRQPDPVKYFLQNYEKFQHNEGVKYKLQNWMSREFGVNVELALRNETYFQEYLTYIERKFALVLVMEYYDEGLILLKRKFCWEMKTVLYLSQRNASYHNKQKAAEEYGELYSIHQQYTPLDYKLYNHFLNVHTNLVANGGTQFQLEVQTFKDYLQRVTEFCIDICTAITSARNYWSTMATVKDKMLIFEETDFNERFSLTGYDCIWFGLSRQDFEDVLHSRQYPQACKAPLHVNRQRNDFTVKQSYCGLNITHFPEKVPKDGCHDYRRHIRHRF